MAERAIQPGAGLTPGLASGLSPLGIGARSPRPRADCAVIARAGYALIAFTFLGLGGWAAFASVDSAVTAPGVVAVEGKRQVVQHLEGGIVGAIVVREGQEVTRDALLFRLDDTQARAAFDAAQAQLLVALALEARLLAERDEAGDITFPPELSETAADPAVKAAMADQRAQFADRRAAYLSQIGILEGRQEQLTHEIEGLGQELWSANQQLAFIEDELAAVRQLQAKGLVNKSRVSSLEREKARLEGLAGRNLADTAKVHGSMGELKMQMSQVREKRAEEIGERLTDVRQKLGDLVERAKVARSVLARMDIRAPAAGRVQNINPRIYTVGAVVRPGDTLLEIVPLDAPLVVDARVPVEGIDRLKRGDGVEIRFPAFHGRTTPLVLGRLGSVSRDRLEDEVSHQPYFLARVAVSDADVPPELKGRLRPGLNAEVVFSTGRQTVLSYMVRPLADALSRAFRER